MEVSPIPHWTCPLCPILPNIEPLLTPYSLLPPPFNTSTPPLSSLSTEKEGSDGVSGREEVFSSRKSYESGVSVRRLFNKYIHGYTRWGWFLT